MAKNTRTREIEQIVKTYTVSRRTAQRYLQTGKIPDAKGVRRIGGDGKRYPAKKRQEPTTPLEQPLKIARSNLRRAAHIAESDGLYPNELALLREIEAELGNLLAGFKASP